MMYYYIYKILLYLQTTDNLIVDIGSEKLSYKNMMLKNGKSFRFKKSYYSFTIYEYKYLFILAKSFTPVPFSVAKALIEGLKSEVVIQNNNAKNIFQI